MPFTTLRSTNQWTLQQLEYTNDLVLAADSPELAQELLTRQVITLRKYNMNIALTKSGRIHVGGNEVPETLTVEGERIVRPQRVPYLDSMLDANGDSSSAVRVVLNTVMVSTNHHEAIAKSCLIE